MSELRLVPDDDANRTLVNAVHPPGWVNPEPAGTYNLVVIGAGTGGLVAAAGAAGVGGRVALIERHLMGGDCLNFGCVPSKTLLRSAHAAMAIRDAKNLGVHVKDTPVVAFSEVMQRVRAVRAKISENDSAERFRKLGVDVYLGEGRFVSETEVEVAGKRLRFKKAVIATGARAAPLPIPGLDETGYVTNESVFSLTTRPDSLAVIGGGPIGCELAQAFCGLGIDVHLFHDKPHILDREDADAAAIVQQRLIMDGVHLYLNADVKRVREESGRKVLEVACGGDSLRIAADTLLIAAGRKPNVENLGLETAGVNSEPGTGITVNDRLQTSNRNVYAVGDCCMQHKFTHAADFAARMVVQNALFYGRKKLRELTIPWCTYTMPEIAHVGLYPHEAEEQGVEIDTYEKAFSDVDRAITENAVEGFVKIHTLKGKDSMVGATIVGAQAGDLISEVSVAMAAGMGLGKLANVIHPYPTTAEAIRQCGDAYNRTRLTPFVKKLFRAWLSGSRS